jgi:type IV pilus assembly protein PilC
MTVPTTFVYKVRDKAGQTVEGELDGETATLVAGKLRSMGYTPVSIEKRASGGLTAGLKIPSMGGRLKLKDVAVFSRQFATMIDSGLALLRALGILAEQTENKALAAIVDQVRIDVEKGSSLSVALARHPKAFNNLYVAMVRSGEASGALDSVLVRLADTIEKQVELRRKIKSAMTYPVVVFFLVLMIASAMLMFIVPQFKTMYADLKGKLPALTSYLITLSDAVRNFFPLFALAIALAVFAFRRWIKTNLGRAKWDAFKLRVPVFGSLVRKTALSRFSRTLAALTRSGVPILESLDIVAQTSGNQVVAAALDDVQRAVKGGDSIARPLENHEIFPPMVVQMMAVGEETGALDEMLDKIADFYDQEVEATVDALTSLIEPLLICFMGGIVGGMIIALYMPMFNIIKLIK